MRGCEFALFESAGASPGTFTQMGWQVEDIDAVVAELRRRGVVFEEVDLPGLKTVDGIAEVRGNYPSKGASASSWPDTSSITLPHISDSWDLLRAYRLLGSERA